MTAENHERIILVEDDTDLRESLLEYLGLAGYQVDGVGSALEFYRQMTSRHYAVAILDIGLPDQDGFTLAAYLRQNHSTGIIILSARTATDDRIKGYRSGADAYLIKPVDGRELAAAIASQLQRRRNHQENNNPQSQSDRSAEGAWFFQRESWLLIPPNGNHLELSGKEMELTELLLEQPGGITRREDILERLYQRDDDHANRALESLVRRLRKKIAEAGGGNPIKTSRGAGYCFSAPIKT